MNLPGHISVSVNNCPEVLYDVKWLIAGFDCTVGQVDTTQSVTCARMTGLNGTLNTLHVCTKKSEYCQ